MLRFTDLPSGSRFCGVDVRKYTRDAGADSTSELIRTLCGLRVADESIIHAFPVELLHILMTYMGMEFVQHWVEDVQRCVHHNGGRAGSFIADVHVMNVAPNGTVDPVPALSFRVETVAYPRFHASLSVRVAHLDASASTLLQYVAKDKKWTMAQGTLLTSHYFSANKGRATTELQWHRKVMEFAEWFMSQSHAQAFLAKCTPCC